MLLLLKKLNLEALKYYICNNKKHFNIEDIHVRQSNKIQDELFILLTDCMTGHFNSFTAVMMGRDHEKSVKQN